MHIRVFLAKRIRIAKLNMFLDRKEETKIIDVGKLLNNISYTQKKTNVKKHIL